MKKPRTTVRFKYFAIITKNGQVAPFIDELEKLCKKHQAHRYGYSFHYEIEL